MGQKAIWGWRNTFAGSRGSQGTALRRVPSLSAQVRIYGRQGWRNGRKSFGSASAPSLPFAERSPSPPRHHHRRLSSPSYTHLLLLVLLFCLLSHCNTDSCIFRPTPQALSFHVVPRRLSGVLFCPSTYCATFLKTDLLNVSIVSINPDFTFANLPICPSSTPASGGQSRCTCRLADSSSSSPSSYS